MGITIRFMKLTDYENIYALWTGTQGVGLRARDDTKEGIGKFLRRNPATCFVAEWENTMAGVILSGHDGRRGYIYHTAVKDEYRGRGIGTALVEAVEKAMRSEGINKIALVAFAANQGGNAFWEKMGYAVRGDLVYRNKDC
jgi:ribosomal protein S18 acetylase RimI-like enzyme